jgi:hypothetical protein
VVTSVCVHINCEYTCMSIYAKINREYTFYSFLALNSIAKKVGNEFYERPKAFFAGFGACNYMILRRGGAGSDFCAKFVPQEATTLLYDSITHTDICTL